MKKLSKYTLFYENDGKTYIYHQTSEALLDIDDELAKALRGNDLSDIPEDIIKCMEDNGFVVDDNVDETCSIRYANLTNRYNSKLMRVTIMPTQNCNFRCWYCYEQHKPSLMTEDDAQAVLKFIESEAEEKHIEVIMLDWFGGEPLMRFNQVVYPLSKELKAWCGEHEIRLQHTITTNGSLINDDMAAKMNEIGLYQFQITLDGGREQHNKVKNSPAMKDSFSVIVNNIHTLCRTLKYPNIDLRINYTEENIDSAFTILDAFDEKIRRFIWISPHIVWQEGNKMKVLAPKIEALRNEAISKGYGVMKQTMTRRCSSCYVENMEQFVVNYDMKVYKCTARDFNDTFCVGRITGDGRFEPNRLYYQYYATPAPFMRKECLECNLLPSCLYASSCLQKKIENHTPECFRNQVTASIREEITRKIKAFNAK